jgi:hypothetical protein
VSSLEVVCHARRSICHRPRAAVGRQVPLRPRAGARIAARDQLAAGLERMGGAAPGSGHAGTGSLGVLMLYSFLRPGGRCPRGGCRAQPLTGGHKGTHSTIFWGWLRASRRRANAAPRTCAGPPGGGALSWGPTMTHSPACPWHHAGAIRRRALADSPRGVELARVWARRPGRTGSALADP